MRVLVIGAGGREHALCLALARDPPVTELHVRPGQPRHRRGRASSRRRPHDAAAVAALARELGADLVVVGPEAPLVAGVGRRRARRRASPCFGPSARGRAARGQQGVRQGRDGRRRRADRGGTGVCDDRARLRRRARRVRAAVRRQGTTGSPPARASSVTDDRATRRSRTRAACGRVVVEEFLDGPEVSLFASPTARPSCRCCRPRTSSGSATATPARTPAAWAPTRRCRGRPPDLVDEVVQDASLQPTVDEMAARGTPFAGLLYAGLALTSRGPAGRRVQRRFGDPETQVVLAAAARRRWPGCCSPARPGTLAEHAAAAVADERGRHRRRRSRGLPGRPAHRRRDHRHRRGRAGRGRRRAARRHRARRRAARHRRRPGARRSPRSAPTWHGARQSAYEAVARISIGGAHRARTSPSASARGELDGRPQLDGERDRRRPARRRHLRLARPSTRRWRRPARLLGRFGVPYDETVISPAPVAARAGRLDAPSSSPAASRSSSPAVASMPRSPASSPSHVTLPVIGVPLTGGGARRPRRAARA